MRTQEVIKCRTLFIHFPYVKWLPVQAANSVAVLLFLLITEFKDFIVVRLLVSMDVWLRKTNVPPPPIVLMWRWTHSCLLITQPPKNVYYKACGGKTTNVSELVVLIPDSSRTSHISAGRRGEGAPLLSVIERCSVGVQRWCNGVSLLPQTSGGRVWMLLGVTINLLVLEVRGDWSSINNKVFVHLSALKT